MSKVREFWAFVNERHATYVRKAIREKSEHVFVPEGYQGMSEMIWAAGGYITRDPILQQYRFCNVFRELDRVTCWIRYNIRRRYADHPNLWLMLAIARTINWPDTLQYLMEYHGAWPVDEDFRLSSLTAALEQYQSQGNKVYTGAYMIRAESNPKAEWYSWSKNRYIAEIVIGRLWEDRKEWSSIGAPCSTCSNGAPDPWGCSDCLNTGYEQGPPSLEEVWAKFQQPRYIGWGPFTAYQVVVDMRHTRYLKDAPDIESWSALGPGSRRGLNRLFGRPVDFPLKQDAGLNEMLMIHKDQDQFKAPWVPHIELSDIQNCLCEFDKYERVRLGEGRPRAQYVPGRGY